MRFYGVILDDEEKIGEVIRKVCFENDFVFVMGGLVFGDMDFVYCFVNFFFYGMMIKLGRLIGYGERVFVMSGYLVVVFI